MSIRGDIRFAAILLSRQPRRPCGHDLWVEKTRSAVLWLKKAGYGVVSSTGIQTWELVTALASIHDVPLRLVMSEDSATGFDHLTEEVIQQFDLSPNNVEFIASRLPGCQSREQVQAARDRTVISLADLILPISIRPKGSMAGYLASLAAKRDINSTFQIEYRRRRERLAYTLDHARLSNEIQQLGDGYIIHWTRAVNGPWPGERPVDYYRDIAQSDRHRRSASDTLMRILANKRLIASPRHMPQNTPVVAFSALSPVDIIPLMRWRARFGEMSFEPYGIGIRREVAQSVGVRRVQYGDRLQHERVSAESWIRQSPGTRSDWRVEQEYRHLGDLDFSAIRREALKVFCLMPQEGAVISARFGLPVVSFY